MIFLKHLKERLDALEKRIAHEERREKKRHAIIQHMVKHRTQAYLRRKLGERT